MKRGTSKKGLSTIVSTLLILLLVFVAVGIIWVFLRNVVSESAEQVSLGKFTLDLEISQVQVIDDSSLRVKVKRNPGAGDFVALNFIVEDGDNSEVIFLNVSLEELSERYYTLVLNQINASRIQSIQIAPVFELESGKEIIGPVKDEYTVSGRTSSSGQTCTDTCSSFGFECGTSTICGVSTDCGQGQTCEDLYGTGYVCNAGICVDGSNCTDTCSSLGYECGTYDICGVSTDCGQGQTCVDIIGPDNICNAGVCELQCPTGYLNCDANLTNGCETQLGTTSNCGTCGDVCGSGQICQLGSCVQDGGGQPPVGDNNLFISLSGSDSNNGSFTTPFRTLERAQQEVRALTSNGASVPSGGVTVYLRGGAYERTSTLRFTSSDSGTSTNPIMWQAYNNEDVRITGGEQIQSSWFTPISSSAGDRLIDQSIRNNVYQANLFSHGFSSVDLGTHVYRGTKDRYYSTGDIRADYNSGHVSPMEIMFNGRMLQLAQYPDPGETDIASAPNSVTVSGSGLNPNIAGTYNLVGLQDFGVSAQVGQGFGYYRSANQIGGQYYYLYHCTWASGINQYWYIYPDDPSDGFVYPYGAGDTNCYPLGNSGADQEFSYGLPSWSTPGTDPVIIPVFESGSDQSTGNPIVSVSGATGLRDNGYLLFESDGSSSGFTFSGDRYQQWQTTGINDFLISGLFGDFYFWSDIVPSSISSSGQVTFSESPLFDPLLGRPYKVVNVFEEIDEPGEYYIDRSTGILYIYPPSGSSINGADIWATMFSDYLISIDGTDNVRFRDITFEAVRGPVIEILDGSSNIVLQQCTIRGAGGDAVFMEGSDNGIDSCEIYDVDSGVTVFGGNRETLEAGNNFVVNSILHDFSRWDVAYNPGVDLYGVGHKVLNNEFYNAPHEAIQFSGNDHIIAYNEIHNVVSDTNDAGAIYTGRDWSYQGVMIYNNILRNINGLFGHSHGVYLDDAASGVSIYGNIFYDISSDAILAAGGRDTVVENNLFESNDVAFETNTRAVNNNNNVLNPGISGAPNSWNLLGRLQYDYILNFHYIAIGQSSLVKTIAFNSGIWATKYPFLATTPSSYSSVENQLWEYPIGSVFSRNYGYGNNVFIRESQGGFNGPGGAIIVSPSGVSGLSGPVYANNQNDERSSSLFANPSSGNFNLASGLSSEANTISVSNIGPLSGSCTSGQTQSCGISTGACSTGTRSCIDGEWSGVCSGATWPTQEKCNNIDDDCDGLVDEYLNDYYNIIGLGGCSTSQA